MCPFACDETEEKLHGRESSRYVAKHGHGKIPVVELIDGNGPDNEGLAAPPLKKKKLNRAADGMEDEMRKIDACWQ